jgi:hypothetical protein
MNAAMTKIIAVLLAKGADLLALVITFLLILTGIRSLHITCVLCTAEHSKPTLTPATPPPSEEPAA